MKKFSRPMRKKEKVYCESCIFYSRRKRNEDCAKAVVTTYPGTATYLHPNLEGKERCWEKNEKNNCQDYEAQNTISGNLTLLIY